MDSGFEWDRILIAVALLATMFLLPALVIWRDQVRDRRRFGASALSRPVRYGPDGAAYREGMAPTGSPGSPVSPVGRDGRDDASAPLTMSETPGR
ncbi:hypothetical protein [Candidatus Frankia alpina]|uniref:Uncharacterized protein n=1 Tax=Candidatus Frankia alpina TaxID=2699483 RepID=A0A4S5D6V6_9ACTN|nr:hypothetical protein [Candidatus Frankia alpina]THJ54700.1 hypothetical protein E7Y31_18505 [Candidatus Frankia alpina]